MIAKDSDNPYFAKCSYCGHNGVHKGMIGGQCTVCGSRPGHPSSLSKIAMLFNKDSIIPSKDPDHKIFKEHAVSLTIEEAQSIKEWAEEKASWIIGCDGEYPDSDEGMAKIALYQRIAVKMARAVKNAK